MLWFVLIGGFIFQTALPSRANDAASLAQLIDGHIQSRLDAESVQRVPAADDAEFLRRVMLDLHGVVPKKDRAAAFLDSADPNKRGKLVGELLGSPRFGEHWGNLWRKYLISSLSSDQKQTERFAVWLADRFNNDRWDHTVRDLLAATGTQDANPAVVYLIDGRFPLTVTDLTDLSSRYFLGIRLNCAQCHDHPFAQWTRQDYWGMAAFFAQVQTPGRPKAVHVAGVQDNPRLTLASLQNADILEGFQSRRPTFLGGEPLASESESTFREALARWMTAPENPFFARATVNRWWWHFFGRGIVNPVDDMHSGNVPSHPELLEALSHQFVESGFDLKLLCRGIVLSRTYQQTSRPGDQPDREAALFARMSIKVLSAEQLYDSLVEILGPPGKSPDIDARQGARHEFSQFFANEGDPDPTRYDRGIPQLLRLMNSPQFAGNNISTLVSRIVGSNRAPEAIVDDLFLNVLSRRPRPEELTLVLQEIQRADSTQNVYRELAWALLMSSEFTLNH